MHGYTATILAAMVFPPADAIAPGGGDIGLTDPSLFGRAPNPQARREVIVRDIASAGSRNGGKNKRPVFETGLFIFAD